MTSSTGSPAAVCGRHSAAATATPWLRLWTTSSITPRTSRRSSPRTHSARPRSALALNRVEIHRLENEGDRLQRDAVASLFAGGIDPMVVIRWKDIFESLEAAVDACETVAHVLEGITLRQRRRRTW